MNTPSTDQFSYIKPPENYGTRNVSNALFNLWEKSADILTESELTWFAELMDKAEREARDLSEIVAACKA
jgi:hypothetical protein